ncbi:lecithin retinol acyltransferase family protein [Nocardioides sp. URHA0020]|uniref:lecithin retinol acyltransferase family protein n=1 Tax=Nocardioides sp. URHA0020 TaxID=1380392 RepID=UPI0006871EFD|nr:lecithin retinol acyltransferase family protein [Nocardioides sp. URHA0020]
MARGDHVFVRRGLRYSHHGIDGGDDTVIHYAGPRGRDRCIARTSMAEFAAGGTVQVRSYQQRLSPDDTMRHAESRLGVAGYRLFRNNCEHFAAWSCTGRAASSQVRRWAFGAHGAVASVVAAQAIGAHVALIGTAGAGLYAMTGPLRRRRGRSASATS